MIDRDPFHTDDTARTDEIAARRFAWAAFAALRTRKKIVLHRAVAQDAQRMAGSLMLVRVAGGFQIVRTKP
jgi:hypothetical protein